jgi:hypothetical protein
MIESSVRNNENLRPDAIMSKIKESQEYHEEETHEKNYIIDDADLDMEKIIQDDDWMFSTYS